jgi:acyl carrier protein
MADSTVDAVRMLLTTELGLGADAAERLAADSPLFGELPELDSMAVERVLAAMEQRFDIHIDPDDVDAELFETPATLAALVERKRAEL